MTRLCHKTITAVSIGGREYSAGGDGVIEVPGDAAGDLCLVRQQKNELPAEGEK
jgi:hypothetical protein